MNPRHVAVLSQFMVRSGTGVLFKGPWDDIERALRFAHSVPYHRGGGYPHAIVVAVDPYWYSERVGVVSDDWVRDEFARARAVAE